VSGSSSSPSLNSSCVCFLRRSGFLRSLGVYSASSGPYKNEQCSGSALKHRPTCKPKPRQLNWVVDPVRTDPFLAKDWARRTASYRGTYNNVVDMLADGTTSTYRAPYKLTKLTSTIFSACLAALLAIKPTFSESNTASRGYLTSSHNSLF